MLFGFFWVFAKRLGGALRVDSARNLGNTPVSLGLGMFVPKSNMYKYGLRLLFCGVDDPEVAPAVNLSPTYEPDRGFDAFNIMAPLAFEPSDAQALHTDPLSVLEQRFPGCNALITEKGIDARPLIWGRTLWPVSKAMDVLGYRPEFGFDGYLDSLRTGTIAHYYPPQGLTWWGI